MRFAMFCYAYESFRWTKEDDDKVMEGHHATDARLTAAGKLGPSLRLMPTTTAMTIHAGKEVLVTDGPFAETKEVLLGFWVLEADTLEAALAIGREYASHMPGGKLELRPRHDVRPGEFSDVNEDAWIGTAIASARPRALAALLRYFRDLDRAEDAFQEASVRALASWPAKGVPSDPLAWLIFVGRNVALDARRRASREEALPAEEALSDVAGGESAMATSLDEGHYRDDVLRLLFMCCHPTLATEQQIALALRIVSGLTVDEIARAFIVSPSAIEQRITRAKRRIAEENVPYEAPDPDERSARLGAVAAMVYLLFNEGYSASGGESHVRLPLCEEAIRLARLLLGLYPQVSEVMGLTALLLLQHARSAARLDGDGEIVLLDDQDRALWNRALIDEGTVLIEKAARHGEPGPFQIQAAIAAIHASAERASDTDWSEIDALYIVLERMQPSPLLTLNRAVVVSKLRGPEAALAMMEPLAPALNGLFNFHGVRGALLLQCGKNEDARVALEAALARARTTAEAAHVRKELDRIPR